MPPGRNIAPYRQSALERLVAMITAVAIIALAGYLIVRNEPFADSNLVVVTRIILSLAVAVLGATIPGFLNIGWSGKGVVVRAGGALALFVLTLWLTPTVLPALKDSTIAPLENPKKIGALEIIDKSPVLRLVADSASKTISIRAVYEGDGESQRKFYDVLISNSSLEQRLLSSFKLKWLYAKGRWSSVEQGVSIKPVERYSLGIFVDPDKPYQIFEKAVDVYPPLILPPRNGSGPSVTSIRLEVFYSFEGARIKWHPNSDWDIFYEIDVQDDTGAIQKILSQSWRHGAAPKWPPTSSRPAENSVSTKNPTPGETKTIASRPQRIALFTKDRAVYNALMTVAVAEQLETVRDDTKYLIANEQKIMVVSLSWDDKMKLPTSWKSVDEKDLTDGYLLVLSGEAAESGKAVLKAVAVMGNLPESQHLPIDQVSKVLNGALSNRVVFRNGER